MVSVPIKYGKPSTEVKAAGNLVREGGRVLRSDCWSAVFC